MKLSQLSVTFEAVRELAESSETRHDARVPYYKCQRSYRYILIIPSVPLGSSDFVEVRDVVSASVALFVLWPRRDESCLWLLLRRLLVCWAALTA